MGSPFDLIDPHVFALTSRDGDRDDAMIATWVLPVTLLDARGRLIAVLSPDHLSTALIVRSKRFVVHLLAEDQAEWVPSFGLVSGRASDKLEGIEVTRTRGGLAILPNTCGYAECEVSAVNEAIGRVIIAATITYAESKPDKKPLTIRSATAQLPRETVEAIEAQRRRDGLDD